MQNIAVLIPAYQPDTSLLEVVEDLRKLGFTTIVVVDDGSSQDRAPIFASLEPHCEILRHAVNCGKGRALKTGFNHIALKHPEALGVITVDADGQHHPEDVARLARELQEQERPLLVLGQRSFRRGTPLRSRLGNMITSQVFAFFAGMKLEDTQTGLRGLTMPAVMQMLTLAGEGYDFEMNMLVQAKIDGLEVRTTPIRTIYAPGNPTSHFNPLFDSLKIYFVFLRFISSSLVSSLLDLIIYSTCIMNGLNIAWSLFIARAVSSFVNFMLNKQYVFLTKSDFLACLLKYYALVVFIFLMSYLMVTSLNEHLGMNAIPAKILSETVLFIVSFLVQRSIVFYRRSYRGSGLESGENF